MGYNPAPENCLSFKCDICQWREVIIQNNKLKEVEGGGGNNSESGI